MVSLLFLGSRCPFKLCSRPLPSSFGLCSTHVQARVPRSRLGGFPTHTGGPGFCPLPPPPPRSGSLNQQEHRVVERYRYDAIQVGPGIKYTTYTTILNLFPINWKEPFCLTMDILGLKFGVLDRTGEPLCALTLSVLGRYFRAVWPPWSFHQNSHAS